MNFRKWLETQTDAYGTLVNFHQKFGIDHLPTRKEFNALLMKTPTISIQPEEAALMQNTSVDSSLIGKGINDPGIIKGRGMISQRDNSWQSVLHHAKKQKTPIVAIKHNGKTTLLDGDHRLMASILMNRPVTAKVISWS